MVADLGLGVWSGVHPTSPSPQKKFSFVRLEVLLVFMLASSCLIGLVRSYFLTNPFFLCYYAVICRGVYMIRQIVLESGVQMPKPRVVYAYPYEEMEVGDSFTVPVSARAKVLNANYRASKRLGYRFSSKTEGEVLRVWRVEIGRAHV